MSCFVSCVLDFFSTSLFFLCLMLRDVSKCFGLCIHLYFLLLMVVLVLNYVVRAPAVDYQSVDSKRAAKVSSTNMKLCQNETHWLWTVENNPSYQFGPD